MGQQQSRRHDELLYERAADGDIEAIKALSTQPAGLEWIDKEGKTSLISACMDPMRYDLAKTLIELGANVNAYRPGRHGGTPLHHAAKRGLDQTVQLLLSHGAQVLVRNDDCQTPLDVARSRGFANVARVIEGHDCFFSGWLREFYGPSFLGVLAPQLLARKIWVVIIPRDKRNPAKPLKLELAIYSNFQDAQPRAVVDLWKADIEEPKLNQPDPTLIIFDTSTKTRYKFASSNDGDRQQIQSLYHACRGIPQVNHNPVIHDTQASAPTTSAQTAREAADLAMAINASLQSAMGNRLPRHSNNDIRISEPENLSGWDKSSNTTIHNGWGLASGSSPLETHTGGWISEPTKQQQDGWGEPKLTIGSNRIQPTSIPSHPELSGRVNEPRKEDYNGWGGPIQPPNVKVNGWLDNPSKEEYNGWLVTESRPTENVIEANYTPESHSVPSAPPIFIEALDEGPIQYPTIDSSPLDLAVPGLESENVGTSSEVKEEEGSKFCVICWEAPVQGACIPCGHMAGCMACLDEVKTKKGECPVCRTKINQVVRIFAV